MKKTEFTQLLQGVTDLGAALRGDKRVVERLDRLEPDSVAARHPEAVLEAVS